MTVATEYANKQIQLLLSYIILWLKWGEEVRGLT